MSRFLLLIILIASPLTLYAQDAALDQDPVRQVHWAMAAFFGTGWYQVDQNRSMFVFRLPPRQTIRKSGFDGDGKRSIGVEILYPLTFGLHKLDDIPDFIDYENYGSVSFTPGVQFEIPVNHQWALRPFAHIGGGYEKQSGDWAGIWYGGLKSRYLLGDSNRLRWSLLNSINYAGYKPQSKSRGRYGFVMAGLEFNHPLGDLQLGQEPLRLDWHVTYSYLFDKLNFYTSEGSTESIQDQWELGLALTTTSNRMKIWFMTFEHIGLSYQTSSNGHYKAISVNLRSPFTD